MGFCFQGFEKLHLMLGMINILSSVRIQSSKEMNKKKRKKREESGGEEFMVLTCCWFLNDIFLFNLFIMGTQSSCP